MGMYGAPTPKHTVLRGNPPYIGKLARKLDLINNKFDTTGVTEVRTCADGSTQVNGGERLKETQEYPWNYGVEIYKWAAKSTRFTIFC